ncbi:MAG TPA: phenylalanine--tRNA ligase subunit beta, partial [Polyangiales bacterium]|nr:phenylalanine--tRNA ligase subunit beta [Polyangiales bacterium]
MLASHKWLVELMGFELAPAELAKKLTSGGIEVETTRTYGENLAGVVVAEVRDKKPHPQRDKLSLVTVFDGVETQEVVCGAPNVPHAGGLVAFARIGAVLPNGMKIEERKLGGVVSRGMICSEQELDIGADGDGILILERGPRVVAGTPLADALSLRDTVYTLGLTPNRPDCLGHVGLARELCALIGDDKKSFSFPKPRSPRRVVSTTTPLWKESASAFSLANHYGSMSAEPVALPKTGVSPVGVQIAAPDRCPRYGAALVTSVTIKPSPFAVRYRLHVLGLRAISNVVDATNLILLGFGHPIHAFDLAKLRGSRIDVRLAKAGETMHTLDGQERKLEADDLLICDGEGPVALAGVMGGANSEIGAGTEHVLIECAFFDPRSVRRTSKRTGLHTDSSHRFERGIDSSDVREVLAHAAALIAELSGGAVVPDAVDAYPKPLAKRQTTFRTAQARALLGCEVDGSRARAIFERLGCKVSGSKEQQSVTL